jgi:hypothetical protein
MSEFVECQNCGRSFFAENLDCPYCGGEDDDDAATMVTDLMRAVAPSTPAPVPRPPGGLFDVLFAGFALLAAAIAVAAVIGFARARSAPSRAWLAFEAAFAVLTVAAVLGRRRWGRATAIAFIAWNTLWGLTPLLVSGARSFLVWGPSPAALLLFAWPFLSAQARDRFVR